MSETRRPDYIVTFKDGRTMKRKIELFRKSQWTEDMTDDIYYRVRIDNVWYNGAGGRDKLFLDREGVLAVVRRQLAEGGVA